LIWIVAKAAGRYPKVMVMGALGRCGSGAVDLLVKAGIPKCAENASISSIIPVSGKSFGLTAHIFFSFCQK
jgi:hypothetical protein